MKKNVTHRKISHSTVFDIRVGNSDGNLPVPDSGTMLIVDRNAQSGYLKLA